MNDPDVVSSSYRFHPTMAAPGSPFLFAVDQLFVDAALRGITVLTSAGDGGSGGWTGDGVSNVVSTRGSPYDLMVGGTLAQYAGGGGRRPDPGRHPVPGDGGRPGDDLGAGRRRPDRTAGIVQGPLRISSKPCGTLMRSTARRSRRMAISAILPAPAVRIPAMPCRPTRVTSAWRRPPPIRRPCSGRGRARCFRRCRRQPLLRRAASDDGRPARRRRHQCVGALWAALVSQFNAIFHDQGLPHLGYMNDLLYIAAAIAPGSFNDVTLGNNVSSFGWAALQRCRDRHGDHADRLRLPGGPGYDLATGLGSPMVSCWRGRSPTSLIRRLVPRDSRRDRRRRPRRLDQRRRPEPPAADRVPCRRHRRTGSRTGRLRLLQHRLGRLRLDEPEMAEQSLQPDFDPALVIMFDKQAQGGLAAGARGVGRGLVGVDRCRARRGGAGDPQQPVRLCRLPVGGYGGTHRAAGVGGYGGTHRAAGRGSGDRGRGNDQTAIVRLRQDGQDNLSITFYRSTISRARSTACIQAMPATRRRSRRGAIR